MADLSTTTQPEILKTARLLSKKHTKPKLALILVNLATLDEIKPHIKRQLVNIPEITERDLKLSESHLSKKAEIIEQNQKITFGK
jgi:hypothetical protein